MKETRCTRHGSESGNTRPGQLLPQAVVPHRVATQAHRAECYPVVWPIEPCQLQDTTRNCPLVQVNTAQCSRGQGPGGRATIVNEAVIVVLAAVQPCASRKQGNPKGLRHDSGRLCATTGQIDHHSRKRDREFRSPKERRRCCPAAPALCGGWHSRRGAFAGEQIVAWLGSESRIT